VVLLSIANQLVQIQSVSTVGCFEKLCSYFNNQFIQVSKV